MLTRRSSRWSTALSAGLLFVTLLGCKKVKQLVSGKQESKCASFSACESACNGSDTLACIKLGDMHRTEAHGSLGKWDPEAAKAAYDKACKADLQLGCAKLASMSSYETIKSYELADKACKDKVALGCAVAGSILASGREYPDGKIEKKQPEARALLDQECKSGMYESCVVLGDNYYFDFGDPEKRPLATALYTSACDHGVARGCFSLGAFVEDDDAASLRLLAKACDTGLAGGLEQRDNACRVEAEKHLKWLETHEVQLYIAEGRPKPGTSAARGFRFKLDIDTTYQARKARLRKIAPYACDMGSSDACKLVADNATRFAKEI